MGWINDRNTEDPDIVMPGYNLLKYRSYAKTSAALRQYCRDEPDDRFNNITLTT